jgi:AraC family transcriptional regulator of adaptative response / DNA-3-methyladenine glycosylase II
MPPEPDVRFRRVIGGLGRYHALVLLRDDVCYAALRTHDSRFDGQFFVGVSSTGIYCRPICSVRTPKREHCEFFPSAAAAEHGGFRPCLRCRPELAPGNSSIDAARRLAHAAASLIEDGYLTDGSLAALAERLGVTDRHVRRVFTTEFGVSPVDYAQTQRLLLAKRLLTDTGFSVTDVAMAAGFGSLRRFNALFKERYRLQPGEIRRSPEAAPRSELVFELGFRPPYAWDAHLAFLDARAVAGVEAVVDGVYRRVAAVALGDTMHEGWVAVERARRRNAIRVSMSGSLAKVVPAVLARVKRVFDVSCRPDEVAERLGALARDEPGLRVPGAFDGFEMAVRAVLGQQITVRAARTLAGRIATSLGHRSETPFPECSHVFPSPKRIALAGPEALVALGVTAARARAIHALAGECARGRLVLEPGVDVQRTIGSLRAIAGIGDWTAQYIAMRALAWPDAFPHTDYGVMKALGESSATRVLAIAEQWRPWRAYATLHLWRRLVVRDT